MDIQKIDLLLKYILAAAGQELGDRQAEPMVLMTISEAFSPVGLTEPWPERKV